MEQLSKNITYEHIDFSKVTKVRFCTLVEECNYIPNHWHESIEFIYVIKGERLATIEQKSFLLHDGDCVLVNANAIHSMKLMETNTIILLQIPLDFLEQFVPNIQEVLFCLNDYKDNEGKKPYLMEIKNIVLEMKAIYEAKNEGFLLRFNSLLFQLLFILNTHFTMPIEHTNINQRKKDLAKLTDVLNYIKQHYKEAILLEEIAKIAHFQPNYFCRFFKKHMGLTLIEYQNQIRLAYIYNDLINTEETLINILAKHGFHNYKLFRQLFKKHFGGTPMQIRRQLSTKK